MISLDIKDVAIIKVPRGVIVALMGDFPTHRIEFDTTSEARAYLKSLGLAKYRHIDTTNSSVEKELTL